MTTPTSEPAGNRKRILLVEDEESLRITLAANLELSGYDVLEAETGAVALELLQAHDVDLVLSDVKMPGITGVELHRRLRETRPDLPVVLMTAYTDESTLGEAVLGGVFTVLSKPFDVDDAAALLDRAIRRPVVIVVDEPEREAREATESLRRAGLRAECVTTGTDAVAAVRGGNVDVCVVALRLGEADGVSVLRAIRTADPTVVLIGLAGAEANASVSEAAACGVHRFVGKPIELRRVVEAIASGRGAPLSFGVV